MCLCFKNYYLWQISICLRASLLKNETFRIRLVFFFFISILKLFCVSFLVHALSFFSFHLFLFVAASFISELIKLFIHLNGMFFHNWISSACPTMKKCASGCESHFCIPFHCPFNYDSISMASANSRLADLLDIFTIFCFVSRSFSISQCSLHPLLDAIAWDKLHNKFINFFCVPWNSRTEQAKKKSKNPPEIFKFEYLFLSLFAFFLLLLRLYYLFFVFYFIFSV